MSHVKSSPPLAQRIPLPEGTLPVGAGLLIAGIASYAFFKVGVKALGSDAAFKPISSLWFATFALAPGFFLPLEQEVGRALAHRRALDQGGRPVVRKVIVLGAILASVVTIAILAASPIIASNYFGGDWVLVVALVVAFASYAPAHLARGVCSGSGRYRSYAIVMGADGVTRIVLCAALAAIGVSSAGPFGFAVALSPLVGVFWIASRGQLRTDPGPEATWQEVTPNLGWLLLGSVFAAALINAGPIATNLLAKDGQEELVTQFAYGVLMARVPLFMFQAVQAALLPRLSRLAAKGALDEFVAGFRRLMMVVMGVGAIGVLGALALGPLVIDKVYGAQVGRRTLTLLAIGSAVYMVALATAQAVIALKGHAFVALGWGLGALTFVVVTWLSSDDLFLRTELGLVCSSLAALASFAVALRYRLSIGARPDADSVYLAATDLPLET